MFTLSNYRATQIRLGEGGTFIATYQRLDGEGPAMILHIHENQNEVRLGGDYALRLEEKARVPLRQRITALIKPQPVQVAPEPIPQATPHLVPPMTPPIVEQTPEIPTPMLVPMKVPTPNPVTPVAVPPLVDVMREGQDPDVGALVE